jgi:exopolyphosphatase/guanosine-5'-triphosphate,3'-diphosphate pyrophosphatase
MNEVYLAAIDIGSNAVRLVVKSLRKEPGEAQPRVEQALLIRFPLRLGKEVFTRGKIPGKTARQLIQLMNAFAELLKVFPVSAVRACATSAMREATNGDKVARRIKKKTAINVEIISGEEEARLIYSIHRHAQGGDGEGKPFLYIDVGGGSTQLSLIRGDDALYSHSFDIGTVRMMSSRVADEQKAAFYATLKELRNRYPDFTLVGSGGNINKLYRLLKATNGLLPVDKLKALHRDLLPMTVEKRMANYKIKRDRAEVIGYAADIFLHAADALHASEILVPSINLCDGMIPSSFSAFR